MGLLKEFKEFIIKGNAFDLAVGIIIGAAFGAAVTSLVADVIMPPVGALMGGIDFSKMSYEVLAEIPKDSKHPITGLTVNKDVPAVVISYGKFINAIIALVIQGFAIFVIVKLVNSMKRQSAAVPPPPPADVQLLTEIRDLLKKA